LRLRCLPALPACAACLYTSTTRLYSQKKRMSSGFFGVLQQDDSSDDGDDGDDGGGGGSDDHQQQNNNNDSSRTRKNQNQNPNPNVAPQEVTVADIPAYEDLSTSRADEETVLKAVYGQDFQRNQGVWGAARLEVQVRPPDVDAARIGNQLL
jgi:hypothetical protein